MRGGPLSGFKARAFIDKDTAMGVGDLIANERGSVRSFERSASNRTFKRRVLFYRRRFIFIFICSGYFRTDRGPRGNPSLSRVERGIYAGMGR